MTEKQLIVGSFHFRATDGLILAALAFFSLLSAACFHRVENAWMLVLKNISAGMMYVTLVQLSERTTKTFLKFFLRLAAVMLAYAYLFGAIDKLQLILHGRWLDRTVLDLEQSVFGAQPTLWLEKFISKPLTEWMMFTYVIYIPMYLILCGIIFYLRGRTAMEDYFLTLGISNILCDIGFILFPVAGPIPFIGQQYSVPLSGYFFTWFGEAIRHHAHFVGGSIPSPHCANATVMWLMAYRYHRPSFWILSPIVLSLYVATFYGRYHYVTDAVVGVLVAFLALAVAPALRKGWNSLVAR